MLKLLKILKLLLHPKKFPYFFLRLKQLQVKKVIIDNNTYYYYKKHLFPEYLDNGNAASFILEKAKQYCIGQGIDVGAGSWPFPGAIPIQDEVNQNAYRLDNFKDNSLDYVFSSHCLEHLKKWKKALQLWVKKLKVGGILFLYLPHKSMFLWNPGGPWVGYYHKWSPTHEVIRKYLLKNGMEILEYNQEKDEYWSFHVVARKLS